MIARSGYLSRHLAIGLHEYAYLGGSAPLKEAGARRRSCTRELPTSFAAPNARALQGAFRDTLGLSVHDYLTRVRVSQAIPLLREERSNVDAVARFVGYKSTKNLYQPLRRFTCLTPGELRALTKDEANRLIETIRLPLATNA